MNTIETFDEAQLQALARKLMEVADDAEGIAWIGLERLDGFCPNDALDAEDIIEKKSRKSEQHERLRRFLTISRDAREGANMLAQIVHVEILPS
jgi:hypothetical protein